MAALPTTPVTVALTDRPADDRIEALDMLRGVAVCGILFANVIVFFGIFMLDPAAAASLPTASADLIVGVGEKVLVEGKFYSIFSLLFGVGFGLQLGRRGDAAISRFRRRLRVLLLIGLAHAFFVWAGDILMLYAMLGFAMPWFARRDDRALVKWVLVLLAIPTLLYLVATGVWLLVGAPASPGGPEGMSGPPPEFVAMFNARMTSGPLDALIGNLMLLAGRWVDLFLSVRFPNVLGMFVLGLWIARRGVATAPASHAPLLKRWCRIGLVVGLAANVVDAWARSRWEYLPPSPGGLVSVAAQAVGYPMLALGYAAAVALAASHGSRLLKVLSPLGRMALTNYLTHSVVCVTLSYGFGVGLWGRIGLATAWMIALAIVSVQIPLSRWWLGRFAFGPAEWAWRRLTYGQALPMRRPTWNT
jgi:uncharacterized protein